MIKVDQALRLLIPTRRDDKYSRGVVQLATGSQTYPGAGVLGVLGAFGAGAGLVRFAADSRRSEIMVDQIPEVVRGQGRFHSAVIGSGWDEGQRELARQVVARARNYGAPLIVDAGAIPLTDLWDNEGTPVVITPHQGEAAALIAQLNPGHPLATRVAVTQQPEAAAELLAATSHRFVVLKGPSTYLAHEGQVLFSYGAASAWGATAGAGDVLAGVLGAVVARAVAREEALAAPLAAGISLHGRAASIAAGVVGRDGRTLPGPGRPVTASQIAASLPDAFASFFASPSGMPLAGADDRPLTT